MTANELYFVDLVEFTQPNGSSEEYFFIVADSKRKEDVGSLLHIVGSGTPQLYLNITENFCPARQNTYKSRVCLGYVRSVTDFVNIVNFAPLCVTLQNTKNRQGHLSSLEEGYGPGGDTQTCLDYMKQENGPVLREIPPDFTTIAF
ncbi:similar to Coprinopsis cinerea okayama CC1G_03505 hypothetical protein [Coprinopsis cinerea okayama7|uniref:Uncharacterized protein n=1 Tax=Geotrichum candidum TaxID=1173061 RepID=A0A0J9XKP3_GEOCN|nr:similar to Coprinopsis cinerea okayama CC1G_03505 hypothetical protein [Coprinopsis cinerea okayama7\